MGQALYRQYRSKKLSEIVGQDHITKTLTKALKTGRISHAYLLTGPRGVGKTSVARILAHEVNNLPYEDESAHLDIIEIDAASNRRIDEIRDLRDKVYISPTSAKYKVYIIDEVHMLTKEAFNALLKTLEEPPEHVIFILATTDAHKLPETIISRTQRFSFRPIEAGIVIDHLRTIAKSEKIDIDEPALALIAEHGEGSFRDSISLLDQARSRADKVSADDVLHLIGIPPAQAINAILKSIEQGDSAQAILNTLSSLTGQGFQPTAIAKQLSRQIRDQLIDGGHADLTIAELLKQLLEVPMSSDPERFLEIIILEAAAANRNTPHSGTTPVETDEVTQESAQPVARPKASPKSSSKQRLDAKVWAEVLNSLKKRHNTLYGVVRMAQPEFSDDRLVLTFAFSFHQKRLQENSNAEKLSAVINELTGRDVEIDCRLDKNMAPVPPTEPEDSKELTTISNIFGSAELLES